jgi:protein-disulfide isomerase
MHLAVSILALLTQVAATDPSVAASSPDRVEIVLYSDFQCRYCARLAPAIRQLQTQTIDGIETTIQFKNFPLPMHRDAQLAHQAAEAARAQGKFWEMHDLLFANQRNAERSDLLGYARRLGLDMARFERDLDSDSTKRVVAADVAEGLKLGVSGTPTYTINGKRYSGAQPFDRLREVVAGAHREARALAEVGDDLVSKGSVNAPVTLELFLDLQSPVSPPALEAVDRLLQQYPSTVRLQFRNFPLAFHAQATLAHEAAVAAARDGQFWPFVRFVLNHQSSLREQDLIAYAGRLGLDEEAFAETIHQRRYAPRVDADLRAGLTRGVRGSPAIFINGRRIDGVPTLQMLTQYVEAALNDQSLGPAKRP